MAPIFTGSRMGFGRGAAAAASGEPGVTIVDSFTNTVLLLHGDGTNATQNNTFLDSSSNNYTLTRTGSPTQGAFSPYGDNWSNSFNGSTDYLYSVGTGFNVSTSDFTAEAFFYATSSTSASYGSQGIIFGSFASDISNNSHGAWDIRLNSSNEIVSNVFSGGNVNTVATISSVSLNTWHHVALVRSGNNFYLYLDGTRYGSLSSNLTLQTQGRAYVGGASVNSQTGYQFPGYISNVRFVSGTAVYTASTITVPTSPLTAISGTQFLSCHSNRFRDASSNAYTTTLTSSPSVERFSPFLPSAAYDSTIIGSSGSFDGSSDYLRASPSATNIVNQNFTLEYWVYPLTVHSGHPVVIGSSTPGIIHLSYDTNGKIYSDDTDNGSSGIYGGANGKLQIKAWNHLALVRSSNTFTIYVNGESYTSNSGVSAYYTGSSNRVDIGGVGSTGTANAYIADVRLTRSAVYSGTFTPPTAPLSSGSAFLHAKFDNGKIIDNAMINNLRTIDNAQISTSDKKFGSGSLYFDGTGDYLSLVSNVAFGFGTGDFTVECWVNTTTKDKVIFDNRTSDAAGVFFIQATTGRIGYYDPTAGSLSGSTTDCANGSWNHLAWSRSGSTLRMFVNGTQEYSGTVSSDFGSNRPARIGASYANTSNFNGYIDDLRVTKGVARYTTNFIAPTSAFLNN